MNARQMAAMAEATRLTRQGRLVEATALIQQTLASPAVTGPALDAPPAGQQTQPRRIHAGWMTPRAAPSRGAQALRRTHRPAVPAVKPPAGRFDAFSYSNAAGTRAYRLYVPAGCAGGPMPLV